MPIIDDFEDGDVAEWSDTDGNGSLSAVTSRAYGGSTYAGKSEGTHSNFDSFSHGISTGTDVVDTITFYWQETSSQTGFAVSFYNRNGDREVSVGSNNPQWTVNDADYDALNFFSGDGYDRWIEFTIDFNWSKDEYTISGEDLQSGSTDSYTGTLIHGVDIESLSIGGEDVDWNCDASSTWYDDFQYTTKKHIVRLTPDTIITSTNLNSPTTSQIGSEDGTYTDASNDNSDTDIRVGFPTPSDTLTGTQEFHIVLGKSVSSSNDPGYTIYLYEAGSQVAELASGNVTSTPQTVTATWNGGDVSSAADVECRVSGTATGGPTQTTTVHDLIAWDSQQLSPATSSVSFGETLTVSGDGAVGSGRDIASDSTYVFESTTPIRVGAPGDHSYVVESGAQVVDSGASSYVFESGTALRGSVGFDTGTIEDFERQNPTDEYEGPAGDYLERDNTSMHANWYIEAEGSGIAGFENTFIWREDILVGRGQEIRMKWRPGSESGEETGPKMAEGSWPFAMKDADNWYAVGVRERNPDGDNYIDGVAPIIWKSVDGTVTKLAEGTTLGDTDIYDDKRDWVVTWRVDGLIKFEETGENIEVSTFDNTFTQGHLGWGASPDSRDSVAMDYARATNL